MTLTEAQQTEQAHRQEAPQIDWNYVVRLPSGDHQRMNVFEYNINFASKTFKRNIQLEDTSWIRMGCLTVCNLS